MTKARNIAELANDISVDSNRDVTLSNLRSDQPMMFRNKIINGDMRIDQRNAGSSVSLTSSFTYTLDRWLAIASLTSKFSVQQNAGSVTPPAGFTNYLGATSLSAHSVGSIETFAISQRIEGFNAADFGWGTAAAKTITISAWVRSSLTGTFGGALRNSAIDRSYPFTYTISIADTWEYKTVIVDGDTTGTWLTNNGTGLEIIFGLGSGLTRSGTAGAWAGTNYTNATGATSVVGTNGATFYITGVQLEVGTVPTPFEHRPYGTELALCQRYAIMFGNNTVDSTGDGGHLALGWIDTIDRFVGIIFLPTTMRERPALNAPGTNNFEIAYTDLTISTVSSEDISLIQGLSTKNLVLFTIDSGQTNQRRQQPASIRYANNSLTNTFLLESEL